jgi:hypothetical protein
MANDREKFDVSSFLASFDKEFTANTPVTEEAKPDEQVEQTSEGEKPTEPEKVATEETPVVAEEKPAEDSTEVPVEEPIKVETPVAPTVEAANDPDLHKRNEAFKKLREEKEKLEQSDKFLADLANQYGLTKDELMKKFKEEQTVKQAKEQGMSVEQFKRLQQLEQQVQTISQKSQQEVFNYEAERLVQKYNIPANQINEVFGKIGALGIDVLANPKLLEVAYKALNYEVALQKGRQSQLEETKKRRETTASPSLGTKGPNVDSSSSDEDAEIDAFLKERFGK